MKEGDAKCSSIPQRLQTTRNAALTVLSAGAAMLIGCEIHPVGTRAKLAALQKKARSGKHHTTHHRKAASEDTMYVSPAWLSEYHEMEAEHGGYSIADDRKIQDEGDKVKVPRTVLKHFHDLSRTPKEEKDTPP